MADGNSPQAAREPIFNAPLLTLVLPAVILAGYGLQTLAGPAAQTLLVEDFGLTAILLRQGQWGLLLSHMFLHGSWTHAGLNAAFCLAFSAPVVRAMGRGPGGVLSFLVFFLLCGVVGGLGYCLVNWHSSIPIIGASGAISGLMGAASRMMRTLPGRLNGFLEGPVVVMTVFWCVWNVALAFVPWLLTPDLPAGTSVAWQVHVFGFLAGLLLIGPWLRLFHREYFTTN